jgi:hypothetical protein
MFNYRYYPFAPLFALRSADEKNSLQLSVRTHCCKRQPSGDLYSSEQRHGTA